MNDDVYLNKFDPNQTRDQWGKWSKVPGTSGKAKGMATRAATQSAPEVAAAAVAAGGHPADAVVLDQADRIAEETRKTGKELGMLVDGSGQVLAEVQGQKSSIFVEQGVAHQVIGVEGGQKYSVEARGKLTAVHSHPNETAHSNRDVEDLVERSRSTRSQTVVTSNGDVLALEMGGNPFGVLGTHRRLMKRHQDNIMEATMKGEFGGPPTIREGNLVRANKAIDKPRHEAFVVATHAAIVQATAGGGMKLTARVTQKTKDIVQRVKAQNPSLYGKLIKDSTAFQRWKDMGYDAD